MQGYKDIRIYKIHGYKDERINKIQGFKDIRIYKNTEIRHILQGYKDTEYNIQKT